MTLGERYLRAKQTVIAAGHENEVVWMASRDPHALTEPEFLKELAWVILNSGMRESVVRKHFPAIEAAFLGLTSAQEIVDHAGTCVPQALAPFGHRKKMQAIVIGAEIVCRSGFAALKADLLAKDPVPLLREFPFIGETTVWHLMKNLGFDVPKPDRHLLRIAAATGYGEDVVRLCTDIARETGDRVAVVDIVLWRYATLEPGYLEALVGDES